MAFTALLLIVILSLPTVNAETTITYYIPEGDFSVNVPLNFTCITTSSDKTDPFFLVCPVDPDLMFLNMRSQKTCLVGVSDGIGAELSLAVVDTVDLDISTLSDSMFPIVLSNIENAYKSTGAYDFSGEMFQGIKDRAILLHYCMDESGLKNYVVQYSVVHNKQTINIRLCSYNQAISASQEGVVLDILNSIVWDAKPELVTDGNSESYLYINNDTGLTFSVPSNWNTLNLNENSDNNQMKYRIGNEDAWVFFECNDFWNIILDSYGDTITSLGITRGDIDNSFLSHEFLIEAYGCTESQITTKIINDQEYYNISLLEEVNLLNTALSSQDEIYVCVRNGYIYRFHLSGFNISQFEDQFVSFISSVRYQ